MKATYFTLALVLCGVLFGTASGCVVDFPDELPYACEADTDCGGAPHVCTSLPDGRKYCCKPEPEQCNKLDDDCNGVADDLPPEPCYTGPAETRNVGACRPGKPACNSAGTITCVGEVLPTAEVCNGKDDDCDGLVDEGFDFQTGRNNCGRCDQACTELQDCVAGQCVRRKETTCDNNLDDDSDGLVDCADPDCNSLPCGAGCTCIGGKKAETSCANDVDDEGDGLKDCADPDCDSRSCGAGCLCLEGKRGEGDCLNTDMNGAPVDDDGDGLANCADSDCTDKSCGDGCVCRGGVKAEDLCDDNEDNDGDTKTDCADTDCTEKVCGVGCVCRGGVKAESLCDDGLDNDADTKVDCADTDCANRICGQGCLCVNLTKKEVVCYDNVDNDGDTRVDCADTDCSNQECILNADGTIETAARCDASTSSCKELSCNDGRDNDRDGRTDCQDSDCLNQPCGSGNRRCNSSGQCQ
jgi:hypothetical protein